MIWTIFWIVNRRPNFTANSLITNHKTRSVLSFSTSVLVFPAWQQHESSKWATLKKLSLDGSVYLWKIVLKLNHHTKIINNNNNMKVKQRNFCINYWKWINLLGTLCWAYLQFKWDSEVRSGAHALNFCNAFSL